MTEELNDQRVQDVLIGEMPTIGDPPDVMVSLPRGVFRNGYWETEAEVRELTGEDEEYLAKFKDLNDYFDQVLARGTVRLGSQDLSEMPTAQRAAFLGQLLVGEREMLMRAIIQATYGDMKTFRMTCPNEECNAEFDFDLYLSADIKFKEVEDLQHLTFLFQTARRGEIEYRPYTGADQLIAVKHKGTPAEQNTQLLANVIIKVKGNLLSDPVRFTKQLSMKDRALFIKELTDRQPSANLTITIPCASCHQERPTTFSWWDFFRP